MFPFGSQFTSKQLERLAKKAEKESEKEQAKVKKVSPSSTVAAEWLRCTPYTVITVSHHVLFCVEGPLLSHSSLSFLSPFSISSTVTSLIKAKSQKIVLIKATLHLVQVYK